MREEVAEAVHSLRAGKSPGVDSELLKNGDEATTVLTTICQKIWEDKGMAERVNTILYK